MTTDCHFCKDLCILPHVFNTCQHTVCIQCIKKPNVCPTCSKKGTATLDVEKAKVCEAKNPQHYASRMRGYVPDPPLELNKCTKPASSTIEYTKAYIDFEATDKIPLKSRITQIGIVLERPDGVTHTFETLVKADQKICKMAQQITGITNEMLKDAPECKDALISMFEFISKYRNGHPVVLIAHNGHGYDYKLLLAEMWRRQIRLYPTLKKCGIIRFFDSLTWARIHVKHHRLVKREDGKASFRLGDIYKSMFDKEFDNAHDAVADCRALMDICNCEYFRFLKINMHEPDQYICRNISQTIEDFKRARESIERASHEKLKRREESPCTSLLDFFKKRKV